MPHPLSMSSPLAILPFPCFGSGVSLPFKLDVSPPGTQYPKTVDTPRALLISCFPPTVPDSLPVPFSSAFPDFSYIFCRTTVPRTRLQGRKHFLKFLSCDDEDCWSPLSSFPFPRLPPPPLFQRCLPFFDRFFSPSF